MERIEALEIIGGGKGVRTTEILGTTVRMKDIMGKMKGGIGSGETLESLGRRKSGIDRMEALGHIERRKGGTEVSGTK